MEGKRPSSASPLETRGGEGAQAVAPARHAAVCVALVAPVFPLVGGMATQARLLADGLRSEGVEVRVIPEREWVSWKDRLPLVRTLHQYRQRLRRLHGVAGEIDGVVVLSCTGMSIALVAMPVVRWAVAQRLPVVLSQRGARTETELGRSALFRWVFRYFAEHCAALHVSSPYLQRVLAQHGIASTSVPIIIDVAGLPYRPRAVDLTHMVNTRAMAPFHGVPTLIQSFSLIRDEFPQARLTIAGQGSDYRPCVELAAALKQQDGIEFPGNLSRAQIAALLDGAGVLLNTSTADNIPNAILEAFAAGVPVITSAVGGIPDLIGNDERGFLVSGQEPADFAAAVRRAVSNPELTLAKVAAARQWVEGFTWQALRHDYLQATIDPLLRTTQRRERS